MACGDRFCWQRTGHLERAIPAPCRHEQQLAEPAEPPRCFLRLSSALPDLATGVAVAALNCSSGTVLAERPAIFSFASGDAQTWFKDWTSTFKSSDNCTGGAYVGTWSHGGAVAGQLGCGTVSGGLLRLVWVVGNQVGFIAEGSDATAVYAWWKTVACGVTDTAEWLSTGLRSDDGGVRMDRPLGSRYVLHDLLGRGAMGEVYRGTVRGSGAPVAIKLLKPELVSDPETVARFFQERSILTAIDHPNVVRVAVDLVAEGDILAIVMELVQGLDLRLCCCARGKRCRPPTRCAALVCQLLDGLAAVHAGGVVHRDVKPENMLLDGTAAQPRVRLTDLRRVARLSYGASLTKVSSIIGTPEYMAPEVADHDSCGAVGGPVFSGHRLVRDAVWPDAVRRRPSARRAAPSRGAAPAAHPGDPGPVASSAGGTARQGARRSPSFGGAGRGLTHPPGRIAGRAAAMCRCWPSRHPGDASAPGTQAPGTQAPGTPAPRTIVRRRSHDEGNDPGSAAPAMSATGPKRPARPWWRSRQAVIALPASLVILAQPPRPESCWRARISLPAPQRHRSAQQNALLHVRAAAVQEWPGDRAALGAERQGRLTADRDDYREQCDRQGLAGAV